MTDCESIYFPKESKIKIGNTTYVIDSYFDENSENLKEKIKKLLLSEIYKEPNEIALLSQKCSIIK